MNYLLVVDNIEKHCGANVSIALRLADQLSINNNVCVAYISARYDKYDEEACLNYSDRPYKVIKCIPFKYDTLTKYKNKNKWEKISIIKQLALIIKRPFLIFAYIDEILCNNRKKNKIAVKIIEKVICDNHIDAVIGFSFPISISYIVSKIDIKVIKAVFMLDPYSHNYTLSEAGIGKRIRREKRIIDRLDFVFTTDLILEDMKEDNINDGSLKFVKIEFPCIIKENECERRSQKPLTMSDKISFVFSGQLYTDIRNPDYLYKLFLLLPKNYILHIVGGGAEEVTNRYKNLLGKRLICHGWLSKEEADSICLSSDFLVNLNNTVPNQVPSKLFEYINTGKPILNISETKSCPALKYIYKYDNAFTIIKEEGKMPVEEVIEFVDKHRGKVIPFSIIETSFIENTSEYVAKQIERTINDVSNDDW